MQSFTAPPGFEPPPDTELGGTFEAVATLSLDEDGKLTLVAIDGAELPKSDKKEDKAAKPESEDEGGMMDRMAKVMGPPTY